MLNFLRETLGDTGTLIAMGIVFFIIVRLFAKLIENRRI